MCLNVENKLQEDLLHAHQSIKRYSDFHKYFVSDSSHPSYPWN